MLERRTRHCDSKYKRPRFLGNTEGYSLNLYISSLFQTMTDVKVVEGFEYELYNCNKLTGFLVLIKANWISFNSKTMLVVVLVINGFQEEVYMKILKLD